MYTDVDNVCLVKNTCRLYDKSTKTCKYMSNNSCKFCNRMTRLNKLFDDALLSNSQRDYINLWTEKGCIKDDEAFRQLTDECESITDFVNYGKNLYIHSSICGNGKTSWALRFIIRYFSAIWKVADITRCHALFINVPRFLLALKDNITDKSDYVKHIKDNILTADLVIWDDIGTKVITPFESENLLSMIDARMSADKSNIFTSNMTNDELLIALGQRLHSRIVNYSVDVTLYGNDKRKYKNMSGGD